MKRWRRACALAGCPGSIPHDLRRSAVPTFAWAGVTEHVVMKLSGHETPSVFRPHNTISASDLSEAAEKLDAANPHSIVTVAHSAGPGAVRTARFYWGIWLRGVQPAVLAAVERGGVRPEPSSSVVEGARNLADFTQSRRTFSPWARQAISPHASPTSTADTRGSTGRVADSPAWENSRTAR